ncbi:MAG: hypothetical protein J6D29_06535 [Solobacterium sp.]|nr:hypothetical protein [Solobacterium sp.]
MKSQVIKVKNIPAQEDKSASIRVKPMLALFLLMIFGIYSLVRNPYMLTASLMMIMISLFALLLLPDRKLADFYPDFLVLYNDRDRSSCALIYWDEIVQWQYEWHASYDLLVIHLVDGSSQQVEMYSKYRVAKLMNLYAPNKEIKSTRIKKSHI